MQRGVAEIVEASSKQVGERTPSTRGGRRPRPETPPARRRACCAARPDQAPPPTAPAQPPARALRAARWAAAAAQRHAPVQAFWPAGALPSAAGRAAASPHYLGSLMLRQLWRPASALSMWAPSPGGCTPSPLHATKPAQCFTVFQASALKLTACTTRRNAADKERAGEWHRSIGG